MNAQGEFDFTGISLHPENNKESEEILLEQSERLSNNCRKIGSNPFAAQRTLALEKCDL